MRKDEYLSILSERLRVLPAEEYNDIIQYYKEYFEDAGSENEEAVIKELGDVEVLAEKIISENKDLYNSQNGAYANGNDQLAQGGQNYVPFQQDKNKVTNGTDSNLITTLLTISIGIVIASVLLSVVIGLGAASVVCLVAGIASIIAGCLTLETGVATCILFIGAGFIVIAIALGFSMATFSISQLMSKLYRKVFGNKKGVDLEKKHI